MIFKIISVACIFLFVKDETHLNRYALITLISTGGVSLMNVLFFKDKINWSCVNYNIHRIFGYIKPLSLVVTMDVLIHYFGNLDIVILGIMDTKESVGYYAMATRVYTITYSFLASTATPLLPRVAYLLNNNEKEKYEHLIQRCYGLYVLFCSVFIFLLCSFSSDIVRLLGGNAFIPASTPLVYFACSLFFSSFFNFFIFEIFYPKGNNKKIIIAQLTGIIVNIVSNIVLIPLLSFVGAGIAFLLSSITMFLMMCITGYKEIPQYVGFKEDIKILVPIVFLVVINNILRPYFCDSFFFILLGGIDFLLFVVVLYAMKQETICYLFNLGISFIKKHGNR